MKTYPVIAALAAALLMLFTIPSTATVSAEDPGGGLITGECGSDATGINQPSPTQIQQGIIACTEEGIALRAAQFAEHEPELLGVLALFTSYETRKDTYEACVQHLADLIAGGDAEAVLARGLPSQNHGVAINFDFPGHPEGIYLYCNASGLSAALPIPGDCSQWWKAGGIQGPPGPNCVPGSRDAWVQWATHPVPATTLDTGSVKCSIVFGCWSTAAPDREPEVVQLETLEPLPLRPPAAGSGGIVDTSRVNVGVLLALLGGVILFGTATAAAWGRMR